MKKKRKTLREKLLENLDHQSTKAHFPACFKHNASVFGGERGGGDGKLITGIKSFAEAALKSAPLRERGVRTSDDEQRRESLASMP